MVVNGILFDVKTPVAFAKKNGIHRERGLATLSFLKNLRRMNRKIIGTMDAIAFDERFDLVTPVVAPW